MAAEIKRDEVLKIVRDALSDILELEADSLALIELVEALEEALSDRVDGFRIEDEDLEDLKTVRDAVDYVHEHAND
jgi:acyl carrier protein